MPKIIKGIIENEFIPKLRKAGQKMFFYTFWLIIDSQKHTIDGDLCFKK